MRLILRNRDSVRNGRGILAAGTDSREAEPMRSAAKRARAPRAGVSLIEMLVVVVLISLMIGIAVPSFQAGLPAIRLRSASQSIAQFLSAARNQVEREQRPVLVSVYPDKGQLRYQVVGHMGHRASVSQSLDLPDGITIQGVFPAFPGNESATRQFVLFPGASVPPIAVAVANQRGAERWVSLDPITYVALIAEKPPMSATAVSAIEANATPGTEVP